MYITTKRKAEVFCDVFALLAIFVKFSSLNAGSIKQYYNLDFI
jgi:hypothetical protein